MTDLIDRQKIKAKFEPWLNVKGYSEGELNIIRAVLYEITIMPSAQPECDDTVSRKAEIDAIKRYIRGFDAIDVNFLDGLKTAIQIIEQLPHEYSNAQNTLQRVGSVECEDAVSRQAAIDMVRSYYDECDEREESIEERIERLPSADIDLSGFSDKLWAAAYERGKAEAVRWIPVSEQLPEDEQKVLFSTKTGRVHLGRYHNDNSVNQWYSSLDKMRAWNNVVNAWMPIPEPYKDGEQNG